MKSLSVSTVAEKNKIASDSAFLVLLEADILDAAGAVTDTIRIVRNNEDLLYQSQTYTAYPFEISLKAEAGAVPSVKITAKDTSRALQAQIQANNGMIGFPVRFMVVDSGNLTQPPEIVEYFEIVSGSSSDYTITFELGAENALALPFPKRRQLRDRCSWRYKGTECKYAGALATCDLTLQGENGCDVHGNTINFGGFPGLKSAQ